MDPVTIVGLVGTATSILARSSTLITTIYGLTQRYRDAPVSIQRLAVRLQLFQEILRELDTYLRQANTISDRVKSTLRTSFVVCEEDLFEIEKRLAKVNRGTGALTRVRDKVRHIWSAKEVTEMEGRLNSHVDMMKEYIYIVRLQVLTCTFLCIQSEVG